LDTIILLAGITLFVFAADGDVKSFKISNSLVAAVALLGITRLIGISDPSVALYTVCASLAILAVGFVLFWQGFCGGGDAKLVAAAALLVGYHDLLSFLLLMSISGVVVSMTVIVTHWSSKRKAKLAVPYGVAIATAGGVTLFFQFPFLSSLMS